MCNHATEMFSHARGDGNPRGSSSIGSQNCEQQTGGFHVVSDEPTEDIRVKRVRFGSSFGGVMTDS